MGRTHRPGRHRGAARAADRAPGSPDHGVRPADPAHHAAGVPAHPPARGRDRAQGLFGGGVAGLAATGVVRGRRGVRGRTEHRHAAAGTAGRGNAGARAPPGHRRAAAVHGRCRGSRAGTGRRPRGHPARGDGPGARRRQGRRARQRHPRSVAATVDDGRPGGQRRRAPAARPLGREPGVPARQRLAGRQRDAGHRCEPGRRAERAGQVGAPHRKDLCGEAGRRPVPRKPVGDRREPPR